MTTLLAVYNSSGCVGRCDAKCYEAQHDQCDCVCGGRNHGAGKNKALTNAMKLGEQMLAEYRCRHPHLNISEGSVGKVRFDVRQTSLL